jgi:hypothetical protein
LQHIALIRSRQSCLRDDTTHVISGNPDAFRGDRWQTLKPGDVFDAQDSVRHAWRNSSAAVTMFCVTTMRIARFLRDITVADGSADADAETQRFLRLAQEHNYWLATPEENAAVGRTASKARRSAERWWGY